MPVDIARLRATVEHLASFDRPSASEGERRAAEWIRGELQAQGVAAVVEEERAVGSMPLPLGLLSAAGVLAGLGGRRTARARACSPQPGSSTTSAAARTSSAARCAHRSTWNVTGDRRRSGGTRHAGVRRPPRRRQRRAHLPPRADPAHRRHVPALVRAPAHVAADDAAGGRRAGAGGARRTDRCAAAAPDRAHARGGQRARVLRHRDPHRRPGRQRQPHRRRGGARARAAAARGAGQRRPRAARLHRLRGVVHGGHARLGAAPRARRSTPTARASWCSRRWARRS